MKVDLPYTDAKPQGAPDFYFAINASFRFIKERFGNDGLIRYREQMGHEYFRPVQNIWTKGGLPAVAGYWRAFFDAEPGSEVDVQECDSQVVVSVTRCPAIGHLRKHDREIVAEFCQHCHYVSQSIGRDAGISTTVFGGNGSCKQIFSYDKDSEKQQISDIRECI